MNKNLLSSLLKIILILIITMVVHISTINANLVPNKNLRPKRSTDSSSSTNNIHEPHHRHRHGRRPVTESRRTTTSDSEHLAVCPEGQTGCAVTTENPSLTCIDPSRWCDGVPDCPDASDENPDQCLNFRAMKALHLQQQKLLLQQYSNDLAEMKQRVEHMETAILSMECEIAANRQNLQDHQHHGSHVIFGASERCPYFDFETIVNNITPIPD